jgi:hypothetical protein
VFHETELGEESINSGHYTTTRADKGGGSRVMQREAEWGQGDLLDAGVHHVELARPLFDEVLEHWITKQVENGLSDLYG